MIIKCIINLSNNIIVCFIINIRIVCIYMYTYIFVFNYYYIIYDILSLYFSHPLWLCFCASSVGHDVPVECRGCWCERWPVLFFFFPPDLSSSPPGPYQQDAYVIRAEEKLKHPPFLPPHLLQVLLNKDTGVSVSSEHSTHLTSGEKQRITNQLLVSPPVRPDAASRAQPRDAQPPVRPVHQGDGPAHRTLHAFILTWWVTGVDGIADVYPSGWLVSEPNS